jgi:hypothetical protein
LSQGKLSTHYYEEAPPFLATPSRTATGATSAESEYHATISALKETYLRPQ